MGREQFGGRRVVKLRHCVSVAQLDARRRAKRCGLTSTDVIYLAATAATAFALILLPPGARTKGKCSCIVLNLPSRNVAVRGVPRQMGVRLYALHVAFVPVRVGVRRSREGHKDRCCDGCS